MIGVCMKRYIVASAKRKEDIEDMIQDATPCIIEPLAQLYLFSERYPEYKDHWRSEVWNRIPRMPLVKHKNKLPNSELIYANSFELFKEDIEAIMQQAIEHENDLDPDYSKLCNVYKFKQLVQEYFMWLSKYLSQHKVVNPKDVYRKLDTLEL